MILDCDLLVGRDIERGTRLDGSGLVDVLAGAGIDGGAVASLRSLAYHAPSGNAEARATAAERGWLAVAGVDLRDPLGGIAEIEAAAEHGVPFVRLAAGRQGIDASAPRVRLLAREVARTGRTLLVEGGISHQAPALLGLDLRVVFLDLHFYDAGEFVLLARDEPGFHASTRLLGSPGAWELVAEQVGVERLVLGTRAGWFEAAGVLGRLETSGLDAAERSLVTAGNLQRLAGAS